MSQKAIHKFNSIKSVRPVAWLALAFLAVGAFANSVNAQWVNENFSAYNAGETPTTAKSSSLISSSANNAFIVDSSGNKKLNFLKALTTTANTGTYYKLADTFSTDRPQGYFSFKISQGTRGTANAYFTVGLGTADANAMAAAATQYIALRFYAATSSNFRIYAGNGLGTGTVQQGSSYTIPTTEAAIQVWYNKTGSPMNYSNPSGVSKTLNAGKFVVYVNGAVYGVETGDGSGSVPIQALSTGTTIVSTIGKLGFIGGSSSSTHDFTVDDIYAADSAPVVSSIPITSSASASAMQDYPFAFQVVASGATTFGATGLPSGLAIDPSTGLISGTPTNTGSFSVDLTCSNSSGITGSGTLMITVSPSPTSAPVITSSPTASGNVGVAFSYQVSASNTPRSYTAANLPAGLSLNTATGLISGTPTTVGDTTVTLGAENPAGTSSSQNLTISIGITPPNIFTGSNASLNTSASWSLGSTPTSSTNIGSFTDLVFGSTATSLTTSSGNVFGKSWNVTNGSSYSFSSVSTTPTTFKIQNNNPVSSPFYNSVAGSNNVLVYLTNGSSVTLTATNTLTSANSSTVALYNSGSMQIGSGSILSILAPLTESGTNAVVTKIGLGKLLLGGSNSVSGGLILQEGAIEATVANSLGAGAVAVNGGQLDVPGENAWVGSKALTISGGRATFGSSNNYTGVTTMTGGTLQLSNVAALGGSNTAGTFTLSGGTIEALVDYDLGHTWTTSTTVGSITFDKLDGKTTTVNGPVTLNATSGATLSIYKLASNTNSSSVVTKTGNGTLKLTGGTPSGGWIGNWQINAGTLFVNTTSSGALGSNNAVVMNGGNLLFSKGVGSSGTYSGHGQDTALSVQAEATITLDPNPLTPAGANTVSFTNLNIGTQTLHIVKGNSTKSSVTDVGYTDPQLSFRSASLTGQATLDVAANVETVMQAGSGTGGVTKIGAGKLSLSSNLSIYAATATTTLNGDAVSGFTVTYAGNPSFPYQSAPTVTISAPASGTQATATATIDNGLVTGLTIVNPGSGYTVAPTMTITGPGVPNSYSGPTTVDSGTLALSGSSASSITIGSLGVLEMALVTSNSPTTTGSLIFNSGAKVRPVGTPTDASYTLVTSAQPITGTPTLEAPIPGYVLVIEGNSLKLNAGTANTAPVITPAQGFSVAENTALATVVGTVVATDADANSTLSGWTIVSGNTGSAFAINAATGQITVAGALNYEGAPSYSLGVTVSDGTATSAVGTVVVTVTNVVEYSDFFGSSSPTADDNGDGISNLMAYALGATSPSSVVLPPTLNTADPTKLTITALIRINDPKLSVVGEYGLTPGTWVTGSPILGVDSSIQAGAVDGVSKKKDFSVLRGTDSKKFMHLKATQAP